MAKIRVVDLHEIAKHPHLSLCARDYLHTEPPSKQSREHAYNLGWGDGWDTLESAICELMEIDGKSAERGEDFLKVFKDALELKTKRAVRRALRVRK